MEMALNGVEDNEKDDNLNNKVSSDPTLLSDLNSIEEINPFLLNPVMEVLMSLMTIADLKMSMGICNLWNQYSIMKLQKLKSQLKGQTFHSSNEIQLYTKKFKDSTNKDIISHKITTHLKSISKQKESFFQHFKPSILSIEMEETDRNIVFELMKILPYCADQLKELRIIGCFLYRNYVSEKETIKWPVDLKFSKLEILSIEDMSYHVLTMNDLKFFIQNVIKNSPIFNSLRMNDLPFYFSICNIFNSSSILIQKLDNLEILYNYLGGNNLEFGNDLLQMSNLGLKLKRFGFSVIFEEDELNKENIKFQLENVKEFLSLQSSRLENLSISIGFEQDIITSGYEHFVQFELPSLPQLKVLEMKGIGNIDNVEMCYKLIDLPLTLPCLRQLSIDINNDFVDLDFKKLFKGSLRNVKKLKFVHQDLNLIESYKRYRDLEIFFPNITEFEVNHIIEKDYNWNEQYRCIPWTKTLRKLSLQSTPIDSLQLDSFDHLKGLYRLELITETRAIRKPVYFNYEALSKTSVKSLKICNYLIHEDSIDEIRYRFFFDYTPAPSNYKEFEKVISKY